MSDEPRGMSDAAIDLGTPEPFRRHPASLWPEVLLEQCEVTTGRAGGPGGQHRNKVETRVVVTHTPTGAIGEGSETRSQKRNHAAAVQRLRVNLALSLRGDGLADPRVRELIERRAGDGLKVSDSHVDWPAVLAATLDECALERWDVKAAAQRLGVSASRVVRVLKTEPRAHTLLNRERTDRGLRPLR
ncbi:Peptide chain release factor 2 [Planctomycetes bacterium LzC2]|uniref:Peptide chain release factor 2 n=2 Tax=Alienimonas chondri TaxID=2681879 RepID=A0ABX1VJD8_9PLAN|nr:Peptide chain release factor 2 [Alienimonas chondri]